MKKTGQRAIDEATADWIVGSDEAGYGTWAGELIVVAVAVSASWADPKVTDSKDLTSKVRRRIVRQYHRDPTVLKVIHRTSPIEIDSVGVWSALICAHNHVHEALASKLGAVCQQETRLHIVDGLENARHRLHPFMHPLAKADKLIPAVSLASCFAKVVQCELMDRAARQFPGYHFDTSRGYGTKKHKAALAQLGPCPIHRRSYRPVAKFLERP